MRALRKLGVPYTDEEIANAPKDLEGKTEEDALIAYMQGLGIHRRSTNTAALTQSAAEAAK
jgi:cytochrome c oxidase cbb3-type subunit 2